MSDPVASSSSSAPVSDDAVAEPPLPAPGPAFRPRPRAVVSVPVTGPYRMRLVGSHGETLPTFHHEGRTYVMGTVGQRYAIHISNPTGRRVEAVVSVDGLDAIDGKPANFATKRGYVLQPWGETTIDGFRTSLSEVATFRFSSVRDSYAGRTGQARDVGVIGVAFFAERPPVAVARPRPYQPYNGPYDRDTSEAPRAEAKPSAAAPAPTTRPAEDTMAEAPARKSAESSASGRGGMRDDAHQERRERSGLGTEFGEARESRVEEVAFVRASQTSPTQVVSLRYNDRPGLVALGIPLSPPPVAEREIRLRETADPFRSNGFAAPPPPRD